MRIALNSPKWDLPCTVCESFIWDNNGKVKRLASGEPMERTDPNIPTRCTECPKVPTWAKKAGYEWRQLRELAEDMTEENRDAFDAYKRFKAIGRFPDDPLCEWYAGIIRNEEDGRLILALEKNSANSDVMIQILQVLLMRIRR